MGPIVKETMFGEDTLILPKGKRSIEVYSASERSGNDVACSKNDFEKSHFPLMKMIIFQNFAIFRKNLGGMESSGAETLGLG